ncbi:hypothetical protein ABD72_23275 [Brevibacillus laterosporus]|nr:hypothetical protein [Brevibacillus laterosporus]
MEKSEGTSNSDPPSSSILRISKNANCFKKERMVGESQTSIPVDEGAKPSVYYPKEETLFW